MSTHRVDVLVVGAGPTGLTAAGDLARLGRSVAVLERRPTMNPASRAFATLARTLEVLDARGLAADLLADAHLARQVNVFAGARRPLRRPGLHPAGGRPGLDYAWMSVTVAWAPRLPVA